MEKRQIIYIVLRISIKAYLYIIIIKAQYFHMKKANLINKNLYILNFLTLEITNYWNLFNYLVKIILILYF